MACWLRGSTLDDDPKRHNSGRVWKSIDQLHFSRAVVRAPPGVMMARGAGINRVLHLSGRILSSRTDLWSIHFEFGPAAARTRAKATAMCRFRCALVFAAAAALLSRSVAAAGTPVTPSPTTTASNRTTAATSPAVVTIGNIPASDRATTLQNIKLATDGIQFAVAGAASHDLSRTLRGVGDAVTVLPGVLGYSGIAFSLAAAVAAAMGSASHMIDPVLSALDAFQTEFQDEMAAIRRDLETLNDGVGAVIVGIDRILDDLSDMPTKVVAETQLAQITTMKDTFTRVQQAAADFASGKLTSRQMVGKCDDFNVVARFSELETIVNDEKDLLAAKFGDHDAQNGRAQLELLAFYMSVIPLVANCNALKYPLDSLLQDGKRMEAVVSAAWKKASWFLAPADRTIHVRESFLPFRSAFDVDGYHETSGYALSLSFKAFSFSPPHGRCFTTTNSSSRLVPLEIQAGAPVPNADSFCVKSVATDDAPVKLGYAERDGHDGAIIQPELDAAFDPLPARGWARNAQTLYTPKSGNWERLPVLSLVQDFVIMQAKRAKTSLDELTSECRSLVRDSGYDRDGDGHSKDYSSAPWTIFCLKYAKRSLRDMLDENERFLMDVQLNELDVRDAADFACNSSDGYVRDKNATIVPSKIDSSWLGGTFTVDAFAVCLKWGAMTGKSGAKAPVPSKFVSRVWLNDSLPMHDKPQVEHNIGDAPMKLPPAPSAQDLAGF